MNLACRLGLHRMELLIPRADDGSTHRCQDCRAVMDDGLSWL